MDGRAPTSRRPKIDLQVLVENLPPGACRQVKRAALRRAHKAATRPGLTTRRPTIGNVIPRLGGPGSFERHVLTLHRARPSNPHEHTFHFTKGHRFRRMAV